MPGAEHWDSLYLFFITTLLGGHIMKHFGVGLDYALLQVSHTQINQPIFRGPQTMESKKIVPTSMSNNFFVS